MATREESIVDIVLNAAIDSECLDTDKLTTNVVHSAKLALNSSSPYIPNLQNSNVDDSQTKICNGKNEIVENCKEIIHEDVSNNLEETNRNDINQPSTSQNSINNNIHLFTKVEGPCFYEVTGKVVTDPIITKNLPKIFESIAVHGKPSNGDVQKFLDAKLREFVGPDIVDEEYEELAKYCSPDHLRTGKELKMSTPHPVQFVMSLNWRERLLKDSSLDLKTLNLHTVKQSLLNNGKDYLSSKSKKLKYRSMRIFPLKQEVEEPVIEEPDLEPGKDMLFHIRIYKTFFTAGNDAITKKRLQRYSLFLCNVIMLGRNKLSMLRDRIVCSNDIEMRVDVSNSPDNLPETTAKELFPSGFLFINNVFYVDTRVACVDTSAPIREWAQRRGIGTFLHRDMCSVRLDEMVLRLGHPEVYVHQGNCEHVFTFSDIRLLNPSDPLNSANYPCHTQITATQLVSCNTCAEFSAKWLVTDCERVPFDPAMFCDTCFRQYLYKDGVKIGDFKAYRYRGNELNILKHQL